MTDLRDLQNLRDFLGREIMIGDRLVYPVRRGAVMRLHRMQVTGFDDGRVTGLLESGRQVVIKNLSNCVVIRA